VKALRLGLVGFAAVLSLVVLMLGGCAEMQMGPGASAPPGPPRRAPKAHGGTDNVNDAAFDAMFFRNYGVNPFIDTDDDRLSTFAVDVDTGSYTLCRSYLDSGHVPPKDAVRVEEFVNYFNYGYAPPDAGSADPFAIHLEAAPSQFSPGRLLMRVGLKAREIAPADRKNAVLTFVIDTSGSMAREDRLELVKKALRLLLGQLREGDEVGIAVYGSSGRKVLDPCGIERREDIIAAIDRLRPEGSTNAEEGLALGYRMASKAFRQGAVNRVVLCSDGVANVGNTGPESILATIKGQASAGITLTTIGFGMGNYNDVLMEQLADKGHGRYAYVDTLREARRVFVENLTGTLQVVARDVKVQVEFNPDVVRAYRLVGYENRDVADQDFRNDKVDGGEVGAGHSVTALYELKRWPDKQGPLAMVRVRYKDADGGEAREAAKGIASSDAPAGFEASSDGLKLAAAAAQFAEILRASYWARGARLEDVLALAQHCESRRESGEDIQELVRLIRRAAELKADPLAQAGASLEE